MVGLWGMDHVAVVLGGIRGAKSGKCGSWGLSPYNPYTLTPLTSLCYHISSLYMGSQ